MNEKTKESINVIKKELLKLKDSDDEKVKMFYTKTIEYMGELSKVEPSNDKKEDKKDNEDKIVKDDKIDDNDKKDDKEEIKEDVKEDVKTDKKVEDKKEDTKDNEEVKTDDKADDKKTELSMKVSKKLKEAAVELKKFENDLKAKEEVLNAYKKQVAELKADLKIYKDREAKEVELQFNEKVNNLINLYNNLGIQKNIVELKENFNEEQIDKLIIDLSAMVPKKEIKKISRQTAVSADLELNNIGGHTKKNKMTDRERAMMLFNMEE